MYIYLSILFTLEVDIAEPRSTVWLLDLHRVQLQGHQVILYVLHFGLAADNDFQYFLITHFEAYLTWEITQLYLEYL